MANENRRAGILYLRRNGKLLEASGNFSYGYGTPKREAMLSTSGVAGYKESPQVPYIEGEVIDSRNLDVIDLVNADQDTITLEHANGKVLVLRDAWYAGDATGGTEEGKIAVRYEGKGKLEEIR